MTICQPCRGGQYRFMSRTCCLWNLQSCFHGTSCRLGIPSPSSIYNNAVSNSQDKIFIYLTRMYGALKDYPRGLPWLLRTVPQVPDVVANVSPTLYNFLEEQDIWTLSHEQWLNDNVINFVLDRLVHLQTSHTYTCKLIYLYNTLFYTQNLSQNPLSLTRIAKQTLSPIRPYSESRRRGWWWEVLPK
jgi:hypothetical protein